MKKYIPFIIMEFLFVIFINVLNAYIPELFNYPIAHVVGIAIFLIPIICMLIICAFSSETQLIKRIICMLVVVLLLFTFTVASMITLIGDEGIEKLFNAISVIR